MTIPRIGNAKNLDYTVIQEHKVVAIFGICSNTLCIQDHALQKYISRGNMQQFDSPVLEKLYYMLSVSLVVKRKNAARYAAKHGSDSVFRFEDGWIFVLKWIDLAGVWLLKTAFKIDCSARHPYEIKDTQAAIRASSWSPQLAA